MFNYSTCSFPISQAEKERNIYNSNAENYSWDKCYKGIKRNKQTVTRVIMEKRYHMLCSIETTITTKPLIPNKLG
jgi:hypothetical protein